MPAMMKIFENATESKLARYLRKISLRRIPFHKLSPRNISFRKIVAVISNLPFVARTGGVLFLLIILILVVKFTNFGSVEIGGSLFNLKLKPNSAEQAESQPKQEEKMEQSIKEKREETQPDANIDEDQLADELLADLMADEQIEKSLRQEIVEFFETDADQPAETKEAESEEKLVDELLADILKEQPDTVADEQTKKSLQKKILKIFKQDTEEQPVETATE